MNTYFRVIGILSLCLGIYLIATPIATAKSLGNTPDTHTSKREKTTNHNPKPDFSPKGKQNLPPTDPPPKDGTTGGGGR